MAACKLQAGFPEDGVDPWARDIFYSGQTFTPNEPHEIWEVYMFDMFVFIFLYL